MFSAHAVTIEPTCTSDGECNDNNPCTNDRCVGIGGDVRGCVNSQRSLADFNDFNFCTYDSCDATNGILHTPISCDDSNPLTIDSCDPLTGCYSQPVPPTATNTPLPPTATATATETPTPTATSTATNTPEATATPTATATATATNTPEPTATETPTSTPTLTATATPTATNTATPSASPTATVPVASALYRETFSYCPYRVNTRMSAALHTGWSSFRQNKFAIEGGILKVSVPGSNNNLASYNSFPVGTQDGAAIWTKPVTGFTIFTREGSFDISEVLRVQYDQRLDGASVGGVRDGSQLAFLINDTWYISDTIFRVKKRSQWESVDTALEGMTFGTSPNVLLRGPVIPANSGVALPASGRIKAFGVFFKRANGRIRLDNFTLLDGAPAGAYQADTPISALCRGSGGGPRP